MSELARLVSGASAQSDAARVVEDISLSPKTKWGMKKTTGITFRNCQFPALMIMKPLLGKICFEGCVFQDVNLDGINCVGAHFIKCSFEGTMFGHKEYNVLEESSLDHCTFNECLMNGSIVLRSTISDCTVGVAGDRARWEGNSIKSSVFLSIFKRTNFIENCLQGVDFSRTEFDDCSFVKSDLAGTRFADTPNCFLVVPESLVEVKALLAEEVSSDSYAAYERLADVFCKSSYPMLITPSLFHQVPKVDQQVILDVLHKARINTHT